MDDQRKMSRQEMLEAIEEATRRKQAGEDPEANPSFRRSRNDFPSPDITPSKPDPERTANRMIQAAANRPGNIQQMIDARKNNPINPETGMPSYSADETPEQEDPQDAERRAIRMQMLQEASRTGQMPAYLKR